MAPPRSRDLAFTDGDRPVLTVGRLEMVGLDYTWPATAAIDRVHMKKSWVLIERRPDGTLPITALFTPARPAPSPAARPAPSAAARSAGGRRPATVTVTVREAALRERRAPPSWTRR